MANSYHLAHVNKSVVEDFTDGVPTKDAYLVPLGYQQIALSNLTASTLTVPSGAHRVRISVEAQALRSRDDGVAPTVAVGMLYAVGSVIDLPLQDPTTVQLIAAVAGGIANVSYYRTIKSELV